MDSQRRRIPTHSGQPLKIFRAGERSHLLFNPSSPGSPLSQPRAETTRVIYLINFPRLPPTFGGMNPICVGESFNFLKLLRRGKFCLQGRRERGGLQRGWAAASNGVGLLARWDGIMLPIMRGENHFLGLLFIRMYCLISTSFYRPSGSSSLRSETEKVQWISRNYQRILRISKSLLAVFGQPGALRESMLAIQKEIIEGDLISNLLQLGAADLKGLLQAAKDMTASYFGPEPTNPKSTHAEL